MFLIAKLYASGSSVPADVTKLTAQFAPGIFDVTITTDRLPDGKVGEAYSQTLTADGTEPVAWSISSGNQDPPDEEPGYPHDRTA